MAPRRPTMNDVAALAGVSLSTVSRVVNGDGAVRAGSVERVQGAIRALGYRRDHAASTLRRSDRASASVGIVFEDVSNPFFSSIHRGVEEVARARGVLTFVASSDEDPDRERELVHGLCARHVDGLIIAPVAPNHAFLEAELEGGVAVVFVDRPPAAIEADAVLIDNPGAAAAAVDHLVAAGHARIGFLGDREELFTARERLRGYRESLARHGIPYDDALVRLGLADAGASNAAAVELLDRPDSPTALLTSQNLVTVGAVHALQKLGRHHEIALVGIDDVPMADAVEPRITVVSQDPVALGRVAGEVLFARLDGEDDPPRRVIVPTEFVVRGSGEIRPGGARE